LNSYREAVAKVRELLVDDDIEEPLERARWNVRLFLNGTKKDRRDDFLSDGLSFLDDLDVAIEKAKSRIEKVYPEKGHRHGVQDGRVAIDLFLYELIYHSRGCGGKIRTSRTSPANSGNNSLLYVGDLLTIVKPYLPPSFPGNGLEGACEKIGTRVNADLNESAPTAKSANKR
jgi:hypothetical protein